MTKVANATAMEKEIQRILDEHCDWTPKRIEGLKKELLNLFSHRINTNVNR